MKCQYCSKPAVYHRKISNETVCKEHFCTTIENKIRKTVRKYNMFSPTEKIVVGVSGGKDSLVLLYNVMKLQQRYHQSPPIEAILIDEGIEGYRYESTEIAKQMCRIWNVKLHIVKFKENFGKSLDEIIPKLPNLKINACTICGTVRRHLLNKKAKSLQADKLAIGHNLDDQTETFLQNIVRNDLKRILQHPPNGNITDPDSFFIPRVKPLMQVPEAEISRYCYYMDIPIQTTPCPYVEKFFILRKEIQNFINALEDQSAEIKYNLLKMNEKIIDHTKIEIDQDTSFDPHDHRNFCIKCKSPCGEKRKLCYFCELKESLNCNI
ncbi:tRNA-5-methyluridine(54) 2-sulfurtransferase [Candidatus Lokiarchaeum ossiferum]|uniref:tRNA-5-methyluridine(54) 2-sulfurtransferase n=1 Tax=Candidatus Lokiarchaeum ossiferum TaxID=2951803 RepID=A0ABY6HV92_9ARCH|nr:tRNA-5-methyluridine(54) 2-sulfurtransferase [Candidatus Lokiarchaeum sp. B-35]